MSRPPSCKKIKILYKDNELTTQTHINTLNRDCLGKVLSYIPLKDRFNAENVSQKWFEASQIAWQSVKCLNADIILYFAQNLMKKSIPDAEILTQILERCGRYLTKLELTDRIKVCIMPMIRDSCRNLVHLSLNFMKHDESYFVDAFSQMNKLKSISIKGYSDYPKANGHLNETEILQSIHQGIEEISIVSDRSMCLLTDRFALKLMEFNALNSLTLSYFNLETSVVNAIGKITTLKYLDLSGSSLEPGSSSFETLKLDNLEHLNIQSFIACDNRFFMAIVANCSKLVYLDASNLSARRKFLIEIGKLKMLKHLDLSGNKKVKDTIINQFKDLQVLRCSGCLFVTDASIIRILNNSSSLEILDVVDTSITAETISCVKEVGLTRPNGNILQVSFPKWL